MVRSYRWRYVAGTALLFLAAATGYGQQITGEIDGTVTDPSGAVVVGATVTITNTNTNQVQRVLRTNSSGDRKSVV